jgi:hypothetical protein
VTRLGWRLKRLEDVMAPANEEAIRIKVVYVDVNGTACGGYDVIVPPRRRMGLSFRTADPVQMTTGERR